MRVLLKCLGVAAAVGALGLLPQGSAEAQSAKKSAKADANCAPKRGRGWAPTEGMARFQAWEIVAQTTGNWPIMSDTFKNERYKCQKEGYQWRCDSWIDVCKK
jgi:hypothetical protein